MAYEDFKNRCGNNIPSTDYYKQTLQAKLNQDFELASDVYTIKRLNRITNIYEDINIRITPWFGEIHDEDIKDDYKRLYFQNLNQPIDIGDLYEFENYRWLLINGESIETISRDCVVRRCNVQLKFRPDSSTGDLFVLDGISTRKMQFTEKGDYSELPRGQVNIFIQNSDVVKKIRYSPKPTRFLFSNKDSKGAMQAWQVESIDTMSFVRRKLIQSIEDNTTGYVALRLSLYQQSPKDDLVNGIAWQDYY